MVPCLSYTHDVFPTKILLLSSRGNIGPKKALFLLQKCKNFKQLRQIHAKIIRSGLSNDQLLNRKLIHLYSSHGRIAYAIFVFHQIQNPCTFTWNLIIRANTINGFSEQALLLYKNMVCQGIVADKFTFPFVIKACTTSFAIDLGKVVHASLIKYGFSGDTFVQNNLIDFYLKCGHKHCGCKVFEKMSVCNVVSWTTMISGLVSCGDLQAARKIFDEMPSKNVVSWTAMINGYIRTQQSEEALELFRRMQAENVCPNEYTMVSLIKACTEMGILSLGRGVHDYAVENGFEIGVYLGTALIDMYSKCGSIKDAIKVFEVMPRRSLPTWNSMITSLGVHGLGQEALNLFSEMARVNVKPDAITFVGILCACVQMKNVRAGCDYFKQMTQRYGIAPIPEHYKCMAELYDRSNSLDETSKSTKALSMEADEDVLALLGVKWHAYGTDHE